MSQSALTVPGEPSLETMPTRVDRTTSVWSAEIHDGRHWRRIHSRDPLAEARGKASEVLAARPSTVVLIGAGLGYLPEALLAQDQAVRVVVVEPVSALAEATLARRDWTSAIASSRLAFRTWTTRHEPGPLWQLFDRDEPEPVVLVQPTFATAFPSVVTAMRTSVARSIFEGRANGEARRRQAGRYLLNTLGNLDAIAGSADAGSLEGALEGVPAVLVAAGPSLDRNLPALASMADRVAVIAVDTALRPLLNAGLQPPLAVALDPTDLNARHLVELPPHENTWLVTEASVAPEAMHGFASRLFTFRVADHHPWPWLASQGLDRHLVRVWGSVLTAALDLAIHAGADPIVFVGADLAFTDGQPYCRHATWERGWAEVTGRGATIEGVWQGDLAARQLEVASDLHGQTTRTTAHLIAFRDWLIHRMAEATGRRFINATGAGILHGASLAQGSLHDVAGAAGTRATLANRLRRFTADATRGRGAATARLSGALTSLSDDTRETWAGFGRGTMTPPELDAAIESARRALSNPPTAEADRALESIGTLPAADRAGRIRAALFGVADATEAPLSSSVTLDDLVSLCAMLEQSDARPELVKTFRVDAGRVPVSLLCAAPAELQRRIERFEDRMALGLKSAPGTWGYPGLETNDLSREVALPLLLAHEWLSVAATVSREAASNAPETLFWLLDQLLQSCAASSAADISGTATLALGVGGRFFYSIDVDRAVLMRRVTGLIGVSSPALRPGDAGIRIRPRDCADPSLAVFGLPLLRIDPVRLSSDEFAAYTTANGSGKDDDGWTGTAHQAADVVTISGPGGIDARLACHRPTSVTWADRSLVVSMADSVVLRFPELRARLAAAASIGTLLAPSGGRTEIPPQKSST